MPTVTYRCEWVKCGKSACRSCPHGPYWYGYWKESGKTKKEYIGKKEPKPKEAPDPRKEIFSPITATHELACSILGLPKTYNLGEIKKQYRKLSLVHHPDRGGDVQEMKFINAAYEWLNACFGKK